MAASTNPGLRTVFRPAPWYLAVGAVLGLVSAAVVVAVFSVTPVVLVVGPIGSVFGIATQLRLELTPVGVVWARRSASWSELRMTKTLWGPTLCTPPHGYRRAVAVKAVLPMFEWNWREGDIGHCLELWAPHLLAEPT